MRTSQWLAALALAFVLATPVMAQQKSTSAFTTTPRLPVQNNSQVVDTTSANAAIAVPMQASTSSFSLTNFLPFTHSLSNKRPAAQSVFPTNAQMPGLSYLSAFGYQRAPRAK